MAVDVAIFSFSPVVMILFLRLRLDIEGDYCIVLHVSIATENPGLGLRSSFVQREEYKMRTPREEAMGLFASCLTLIFLFLHNIDCCPQGKVNARVVDMDCILFSEDTMSWTEAEVIATISMREPL